MTLWAPLESITGTMHRRVCPLYSFDDAGRPHLVGSAVPFLSGERVFLVTAAHVCLDRRRQVLPLFTVGSGEPRVLTGKRIVWEYRRGKDADADLAVIELVPDEAADLREAYQFTTPADIADAKRKEPGVHYLIAGYASSRNRVTRYNLPSRATHLMTGDIRGVADLQRFDKDDQWHFSLSFPTRTVPSLDGGTYRIPKPQGMSGGGIWRLDVDIPRRLATTPLLVGIGIEYLARSNRFVGTKINAAIPLVQDLYDPRTPWQYAKPSG